MGLNIPVFACDIGDFNNGQANLILALFTVLSYATEKKQIKNIISTIKNHLLPGGYFLFDLPLPILFQHQQLPNNDKPDFKRNITLTPSGNRETYEYSETCSGIFNNNNFIYADHFQIHYWEPGYIDQLLRNQGFTNTDTIFNQFENMGSIYKLDQLKDKNPGA